MSVLDLHTVVTDVSFSWGQWLQVVCLQSPCVSPKFVTLRISLFLQVIYVYSLVTSE